MITSITKMFNCRCKVRYVPMGFRKSGHTYARIYNDVLQFFCFKKTKREHTATVVFGVVPLCMNLPETSSRTSFPIFEMGNYHLDALVVDVYTQGGGWKYDPKFFASVDNCVTGILQAMEQHLIPLFEKCVNCSAALPELINLDKLLDQNRRAFLRILGESDFAAPWEERSLGDSRKYYMSLKAKDYLYAERYLDWILEQYRTKHLNRQDKRTETDLRYISFLEQLHMLQSGNFDYFDQLIVSNEKIMHKFLSVQYPVLYK